MDAAPIALALALFGVVLLALACLRIYRARWIAGGGALLGGAALLGLAGLLFIVSLNLHTYARLTYEAPVAELVFEKRGPKTYQLTMVRIPSGDLQIFMLEGDEWQLDARVLKWKGWATWLGLDAQYRLERLSGRYRDIEDERTAKRTVYPLTENPGLDLWTLATDRPDRLPFVDAVYGSATYLPMADGARFRVTLSQTGLLARPMNGAAAQAAGK
jgi:hypothetical protein